MLSEDYAAERQQHSGYVTPALAQSADPNGRPPAETRQLLRTKRKPMQLGPGLPGFKVSEEDVRFGVALQSTR